MSDTKEDYYEILGVAKNATDKEIKSAYRNLCKIHHPDKGGDDDTFKKIGEAYDHLSDKEKRQHYDRFGHSTGRPNARDNGFHDFFNHFRQEQRKTVRYGQNLNITIKLTLEEIYFGAKKKYTYKRNATCTDCGGHGGTDITDCPDCHGSGHVTRTYNTPIGFVQQSAPCDRCQTTGNVYTHECGTCHGEGVVQVEATADLDIPSGVQDGMVFSLVGKGNGIKSGSDGDLLCKIMELPHKKFTRIGNDLKMKLNLTYPELILGGKVDIETIEGKTIRITINEFSDVGNNLKIQSKGLIEFGKKEDKRGDLIVTLGVDIPKEIDDETKELIIKLKDKLDKNI